MYIQTLLLPFLGQKGHSRSVCIGWIAMAFVLLTGSTSTAFAKQLAGSLAPLSLIFVSETIVLLFTVLSFGFVKLISELTKIKKKYYSPLFIVGMTNSVIAPSLIFAGLHYTQAVNGEIFLRTHALFLFIFGSIFYHKKIERIHILSSCAMMLGVAIIALKGFQNGLQPSVGDSLILLGAFSYAIGEIVFKKKLHTLHPEVVLFTRSLLALGTFFLLQPFIGENVVEQVLLFPRSLILALIGYSFISRFLYLMSFYEAMERLPIRTVSVLLPIVTVGSIVFSHFYLSEHIYWYHLVGATFVLLGSVMMKFTHHHYKGLHLERHMRHHHRHHV